MSRAVGALYSRHCLGSRQAEQPCPDPVVLSAPQQTHPRSAAGCSKFPRRLMASLSVALDVAYDIRTKRSSPNAEPGTRATSVSSSTQLQKADESGTAVVKN